MKRVEVGVIKVEMWEEANWSMRLRYLQQISPVVHEGDRRSQGEAGPVHLVVGPLQLVHEI